MIDPSWPHGQHQKIEIESSERMHICTWVEIKIMTMTGLFVGRNSSRKKNKDWEIILRQDFIFLTCFSSLSVKSQQFSCCSCLVVYYGRLESMAIVKIETCSLVIDINIPWFCHTMNVKKMLLIGAILLGTGSSSMMKIAIDDSLNGKFSVVIDSMMTVLKVVWLWRQFSMWENDIDEIFVQMSLILIEFIDFPFPRSIVDLTRSDFILRNPHKVHLHLFF